MAKSVHTEMALGIDANILAREWEIYAKTLSPDSFVINEAYCKALLRYNPELHRLLEDARETKDFSVLCKPSYIEPLKSSTEVEEYLNKHRAPMNDFISGIRVLQFWKPLDSNGNCVCDEELLAHFLDLRIPATRYGRMPVPMMQLHQLGSFKDSEVLSERLGDIFQPGKNTVLHNTSGSGKTRLLMEGLCKWWGFYFTCAVDGTKLASLDVAQALGVSSLGSLLTGGIPSLSSPHFSEHLKRNQRNIHECFSDIMLARLLVFELFFDSLKDPKKSDARYLWLVLQIFPSILSGFDVFHQLIIILMTTRKPYINFHLFRLVSQLPDMCQLAEKDESIFCVLDEANVASRVHDTDYFRDEGGFYPPLKEIMRSWSRLSDSITLVVAGTEVPKHYFEYEKGEWDSWRWVSNYNTGAFTDPKSQTDYALQFFPESLRENDKTKQLVVRMNRWLRGRHRFTASFVSLMMGNLFQLENGHQLLDSFIESQTNYLPKDSVESMGDKDEIRVFGTIFGTVPFRMIGYDTLLRSTAHEVLYHYLMTWEHPLPFSYARSNVVNSGFGRFIDGATEQVVIDEPMMIAALAKWFSQQKDVEPLSGLQEVCTAQDSSGRGYDMAGYLAFSLALVFSRRGDRPLNETFHFPGEAPSWATQNASLVSVYLDREGTVRDREVRYYDVLHDVGPVGTACKSPEQTRQWLNHHFNTAFCLLPCSTLMFVLKLADGTFLSVALRALLSASKEPSSEDQIIKNAESLMPGQLFDADDISILQELPNRNTSVGEFSLLRVQTAFPGDIQLEHGLTSSAPTPLVTLNGKIFRKALRAMASGSRMDNIIDRIVSSILQYRPPKDISARKAMAPLKRKVSGSGEFNKPPKRKKRPE